MDTPTTRGVCFISNKETKMSLTEELVLKRSKAENLEAVRNLNCWGCNLSDVQVLSKLENLEVLNLRQDLTTNNNILQLATCTIAN